MLQFTHYLSFLTLTFPFQNAMAHHLCYRGAIICPRCRQSFRDVRAPCTLYSWNGSLGHQPTATLILHRPQWSKLKQHLAFFENPWIQSITNVYFFILSKTHKIWTAFHIKRWRIKNISFALVKVALKTWKMFTLLCFPIANCVHKHPWELTGFEVQDSVMRYNLVAKLFVLEREIKTKSDLGSL